MLSKPVACPKPQPTVDKLAKRKARLKTEQEFRSAVIARDGLVCRCCGRRVVRRIDVAENRLEVHHLRKRSTNPADKCNPRFGVVVCCGCHVKIEARRIEQVGDEQSVVKWRGR